MKEEIKFDENGASLVTKSEGVVTVEPISSEDAAQWEAEHHF